MKHYFVVLIGLLFSSLAFSATPNDSLVRFSELSFHSNFERQAFINSQQGNEFDLCLASDKNMTAEKAATLKSSYDGIIKLLEKEKLTTKNIRQKYKNAHKIIFNKSPMQYYENAEFSDILINGYFNYVTASVFYSLVLNGLNIPSYYLYTLTKTDIVINPDAEQIILETHNLKDENGYFNSNDNKGFIVNLLDKNIRIGSQYQYNSTGGSSVVRFNQSEVLKKNQLAAYIYFYKALEQLGVSKMDEAYQLVSKACYLYPDETFISSMSLILNSRLSICKFDKVEDVDLLGQLSRLKSDSYEDIRKTFYQIITNKFRNNNNLQFCTDAYNRLLPQLNDVALSDEISYLYYMTEAFSLQPNAESIKPALKALKLKPNDKYALQMIQGTLSSMKYHNDDKRALIDTLDFYEKELIGTEAVTTVKNSKLLLYLDIAEELFQRNNPKEGVRYLSLFEAEFKLPLPDTDFRINIENAYYEYARYYMRFNNRAMAQKIVNKGLEYIPKSNMIESATYNIPDAKPVVRHLKMTKSEYEKYLKKNGQAK